MWCSTEAQLPSASGGNGEEGLEMYIEETILDCISCRYGWGWSCELVTNDFSFLEDDESVRFVVTNEVPHHATLFKPG
jgi:hypothetical protein